VDSTCALCFLEFDSLLNLHSESTINYQARQQIINFVLKPYYGAANLTFNQSQETLTLEYQETLLYKDRGNVKTSGLDALGVRPAEIGFPLLAVADPVMPIANKSFNHLTMDSEGLVLNDDGSYVTANSTSKLRLISLGSG
jgi:hypothetical protein